MAETTGDVVSHATPRVDAGMPAAAKWAVFAGVIVLVSGAVALLTVRGNALLLDLSAMAGRVFCF